MKYLIISDTHLTDHLEKRKYRFLMNLIAPFENIIIDGDFWEARYVDTKKFLNSKYTPLFDLLKSKNTTYIYGNHDPEYVAKEIAERVSNKQSKMVKLQVGKNKFHIEHGHRFLHAKFENGGTPLLLKYSDMIGSGIFERFFFPLTVNILGSSWNKRTIQKIHEDQTIANDELVVCGHTHVPVFDLKNRFIDIGRIRATYATYLILDGDQIKAESCRY